MTQDKPPYRVPSMVEIEALPWNGLNVVSTFSGAGGSCLGYRMAGYRVLWASEFIPAAQEVYKLNHPDSILDTRDGLTSSGPQMERTSKHMSNSTTPPTKTCTQCGETLPATAEYFYRQKTGKHGLKSECNSCSKERKREWYQANCKRECEKSRQWRESNPEYYRQYYQANLDKEHERNLRWAKNNPEKNRAKSLNYHARKLGAEGSHTAIELQEQHNRQEGRCYWCGTKLNGKYEADHVIPLSKGGSNYISNIVCTCMVCNRSKNDKMPHEWDGNGGRLL